MGQKGDKENTKTLHARLFQIKQSLKEGQLPDAEDQKFLGVLKIIQKKTVIPLLQLNMALREGKITTEEAEAEKNRILDTQKEDPTT